MKEMAHRMTTGTIGPTLAYEVVQDQLDPTSWRVEAIDYEDEGVGYIALFMGPKSEERAREYADFKNAR